MRRVITLLAAATLLVAGCQSFNPPGAPAQLNVVASFGLIADMTREVAGSRAVVTSFVPDGADIHSYQATPQNVRTLAQARLVLLNGGGLEGGVERSVRANLAPGAVVGELFDAVPESSRLAGGEHADESEEEHEDHAHEAGADPHAWLDPRNGVLYVRHIQRLLTEADPAGAATYTANADRYVAAIEAADREAANQINAIPQANRRLVTYHDAYHYLAKRYGLELTGFVVQGGDQEPSGAQVAALVQNIRAQSVKAVYVEPQFNARVLELAARDAGVKTLSLYSDSLDKTVPSYVELIKHNAKQLAEGLR
jgi:ABC-type Zn uptake system ZnuABC Zn-binding protein ZnuA